MKRTCANRDDQGKPEKRGGGKPRRGGEAGTIALKTNARKRVRHSTWKKGAFKIPKEESAESSKRNNGLSCSRGNGKNKSKGGGKIKKNKSPSPGSKTGQNGDNLAGSSGSVKNERPGEEDGALARACRKRREEAERKKEGTHAMLGDTKPRKETMVTPESQTSKTDLFV